MSKPDAVDTVLRTPLSLVVSDKHNDLILCCPLADTDTHDFCTEHFVADDDGRIQPEWQTSDEIATLKMSLSPQTTSDNATTKMASSAQNNIGSSHADEQRRLLEEENAQLRAANASLRNENNVLQLQRFQDEQLFGAQATVPRTCSEVFDNPFEPPPELPWKHNPLAISLSGSTLAGLATPSLSSSCGTSGCATPASFVLVSPGPTAAPVSMGTLVPAFFSSIATNVFGDRSTIPTGIVQRSRAAFEPSQ